MSDEGNVHGGSERHPVRSSMSRWQSRRSMTDNPNSTIGIESLIASEGDRWRWRSSRAGHWAHLGESNIRRRAVSAADIQQRAVPTSYLGRLSGWCPQSGCESAVFQPCSDPLRIERTQGRPIVFCGGGRQSPNRGMRGPPYRCAGSVKVGNGQGGPIFTAGCPWNRASGGQQHRRAR